MALLHLKAGLRLALVLDFGMLRMRSGIRRVVRTRYPIFLARILASWRLGGYPIPGSPTT